MIRKSGFTAWDYFRVKKLDENRTEFSLRLAFEKRNLKTWFLERVLARRVQKDFKRFNEMCENGE